MQEEQQAALMESLQRPSTPATSQPHQPLSAPPPAKVELKAFFGEVEDRNSWSRVYQAQLTALGCADALRANEDEEVKLGRSDFDSALGLTSK